MIRYLSLLFILLITACSATVIKPQPQGSSQIDMDGQRIRHTIKGVQLAVRVHEAGVRPSPTDQNYCSFWVEVTNQRSVMLPLAFSDFILVDSQGRQYQSADPAELVIQLTDIVPYLTPYPYVGFYYLDDSFRAQVDNQFRSEGSYFASRRPEYIATDALPNAGVLPASTVAGAIYFPAELRTMNGFRLQYQIGALPGQKSFQMSLPFTVEKN